jgi:tRNA pseudouridine38-40 synthase
MFNYLIKIEYEGTNFVGWQSQKNGKTIQDNIEKALKKVLQSDVRIVGAGRTDKGVHARVQFANFKFKKKIESKNKFLDSINFFLRKKLISIIDIKTKRKEFHARYSARERIYEYIIINRQGSLSIDKNKAWHVKKKLNIDLLKKGAKIFEGTHDFSTFRSSSCSAKSPIKKIKSITVKKNKDKIYVKFCSQSFLQHQVRSMVGCLEHLAKKKWSIKKFKEALKSKKRSFCAPPAPACGLYLLDIRY